jgi:hypothetical protein
MLHHVASVAQRNKFEFIFEENLRSFGNFVSLTACSTTHHLHNLGYFDEPSVVASFRLPDFTDFRTTQPLTSSQTTRISKYNKAP